MPSVAAPSDAQKDDGFPIRTTQLPYKAHPCLLQAPRRTPHPHVGGSPIKSTQNPFEVTPTYPLRRRQIPYRDNPESSLGPPRPIFWNLEPASFWRRPRVQEPWIPRFREVLSRGSPGGLDPGRPRPSGGDLLPPVAPAILEPRATKIHQEWRKPTQNRGNRSKIGQIGQKSSNLGPQMAPNPRKIRPSSLNFA